MGQVVAIYHSSPLRLSDGRVYIAQACGRQREDGIWEGWFEFVPEDGSAVLLSQRETTQPNFADLEYWATGITPVYLEGALERTLTPLPLVGESPVEESVYEGPAPSPSAVTPSAVTPLETPTADPVLNPFSVYAKGEDLLRQQLTALSPRHLRAIIVGYDLADPSRVDLTAMTAPELIGLIVGAVRGRLAA
jgi:hypothetical protein